MATPDMDHKSTEIEWSIMPSYRIADNDGRMVCAMTGFAQRKGEVIYEGSFIDEFIGYFAIGQDSAEQLARLIGWVDPGTIDDTVAQAAEAVQAVADLQATIIAQEEIIAAYAVIFDYDEEGLVSADDVPRPEAEASR